MITPFTWITKHSAQQGAEKHRRQLAKRNSAWQKKGWKKGFEK
jgi:hypothetical protein